jgi:mannosyl-oligosaccharide glucosidase
MWLQYDPNNPGVVTVRHFCRHEDSLRRFGWTHHDGHSFGSQELLETNFELRTDFITDTAGRWKARVSGKQTGLFPPKQFVVMLYVASEDGQPLEAVTTSDPTKLSKIEGFKKAFGHFTFHLPVSVTKSSYFETRGVPLHHLVQITNKVFHEFGQLSKPGHRIIHKNIAPFVIVQQISTSFPFEFEIAFQSEGDSSNPFPQQSLQFSTELQERKDNFNNKFEEIFQLSAKGFNDDYVKFAKSVFSNLIGGIGYFHGHSKLKAKHMQQPVSYGPLSLYTAVPSRSFFPRGFLWDEGFHQLVIQRWNIDITMDVLGHWLDLMNIDGWIPREQILGDEAESRVPNEFIVQHVDHANPPTFFLTLQSMLGKLKSTDHGIEFLKAVFPRLKEWFNWYDRTQAGSVPSSYCWKGRTDIGLGRKMKKVRFNPKTLTSGLDDFPRALYPSHIERHLDLWCWMALAAEVMAGIATILDDSSLQEYQRLQQELTDNKRLRELHWSSSNGYFCDYGNHSTNPSQPSSIDFVPEFGYVTLFPLFMKILNPDAKELGILLDKISNRELLWTDYGLRSLAEKSRYYNKWNNEHDPPYWRGSIWINMNYLAVRALNHYGHTAGPYQTKALKLYKELRDNLVKNMYSQYQSTGYVWESYNDSSGHGQGTHPFTGWSSLIVLIMSEQY